MPGNNMGEINDGKWLGTGGADTPESMEPHYKIIIMTIKNALEIKEWKEYRNNQVIFLNMINVHVCERELRKRERQTDRDMYV